MLATLLYRGGRVAYGPLQPVATTPRRCHAGARHAPAVPRGCWGDLCIDCWAYVVRRYHLPART